MPQIGWKIYAQSKQIVSDSVAVDPKTLETPTTWGGTR